MTAVDLEELERIEQHHKLGQRGWSGNFDQDYKIMCELHQDRAWLISALREARGKALPAGCVAVCRLCKQPEDLFGDNGCAGIKGYEPTITESRMCPLVNDQPSALKEPT